VQPAAVLTALVVLVALVARRQMGGSCAAPPPALVLKLAPGLEPSVSHLDSTYPDPTLPLSQCWAPMCWRCPAERPEALRQALQVASAPQPLPTTGCRWTKASKLRPSIDKRLTKAKARRLARHPAGAQAAKLSKRILHICRQAGRQAHAHVVHDSIKMFQGWLGKLPDNNTAQRCPLRPSTRQQHKQR